MLFDVGLANMFMKLIRASTSLRFRNAIRIAMRRFPYELRERYPDLTMMELPRKPTVIDVGANIGRFSECVLAHRPWARIHAIEPLTDAYAILRARLGAFGDIEFSCIALGSERAEKQFHVSRYDQASSFLPNGDILRNRLSGVDFTEQEERTVSIVPLEQYVSDKSVAHIDLLKLDVQGYELEVLKGAESVLDRIDWIYAEAQFEELYVGGPMYNDLFTFLRPRGFDLVRMVEFRSDDDGNLMECDMIFQRKNMKGGTRSSELSG